MASEVLQETLLGRPGKERPRVLLVEDDDGVASMLAICLATAGFDVARVALGAEALSILGRESIHATILDLGLPDGLGGSVLDWLRQVSGKGGPPYLVISALDRVEVKQRYGIIGENFLAKPFDPWALVGRLEEMLEGGTPPPAEGESR